jgi:hypothetical protein
MWSILLLMVCGYMQLQDRGFIGVMMAVIIGEGL